MCSMTRLVMREEAGLVISIFLYIVFACVLPVVPL
jgi:hypothetical protein